MCTSSVVVNVSDEHVHGPVFIFACGHWNCCLVASKNNRCKHWSMCSWVLRNDILHTLSEGAKFKCVNYTYHLLPRPISRHKMLKAMVIICVVLLIWWIVPFTNKFWKSEHILEKLSRITVSHLILNIHPCCPLTIWNITIILHSEALPLHASKGGWICQNDYLCTKVKDTTVCIRGLTVVIWELIC